MTEFTDSITKGNIQRLGRIITENPDLPVLFVGLSATSAEAVGRAGYVEKVPAVEDGRYYTDYYDYVSMKSTELEEDTGMEPSECLSLASDIWYENAFEAIVVYVDFE